ncbi:MAG TPA: GNAT family N-acetyltransferase [Candidatus Binatia bacterium]|nr:GNAT family N-acetyltransferase [Candidatus Binatia bacterium]
MPKAASNWRIRRGSAADLPALIELERQIATAAHWPLGQYEKIFCDSQAPAARIVLVAERSSKTAAQPTLIAFLIAHRVDAEWEIENIVVEQNSRRQGIGADLASELIDLAREAKAAAIFLEVRESNAPARALYARLAFAELGHRTGYYSGPVEDAILCKLPLS